MLQSFREYVEIREGLWLADKNAVLGLSRLVAKNPVKQIQKLKPFKIPTIKYPKAPKIPQIKPFGSV